MYSWLWAKLKLCQYKFIVVTRRAQDQVKGNTSATLPNNCIYRMAALLVHWRSKLPWSMPKKCNYLRRESRLEFALSCTKRVPLELWCQPKGDLAIQYQKPPLQIQSAMYMYVYIYIVFAIAVYLGSTYTLIKHDVPTDTMNLYVSRCCWAKNFAIHALRPPIKKQ